MPKEWQRHAPHDDVRFPSLGLELQIGAFDGITRISGFKPGGPAESTDLLLVDDEVTHLDGQAIPVGIAAASARVRRIQEMLGNAQRLVEVTVRRKCQSGAGTSSVAHVRVQSIAANLESSSEDDDWVVLDSDEEPRSQGRGAAVGGGGKGGGAARARGAGGRAGRVGYVGGGGGRTRASSQRNSAANFLDGLGDLVVDALEKPFE